jgi:hypothetical protein
MNIYIKTQKNNFQNKTLNDITLVPLESVLKSITNNRQSHYIKCPAFTDYYKNCFLVRAPFDIELEVQKTNEGIKYFNLKNYTQEFCNAYIVDRNKENSLFSMISIDWGCIFYSEKSVLIEQLPATLHTHEVEFLKNIMLVQGTFDISAWYRPLHYAFEIIDDTKPITIKRGDPLFYVRFVTDEKVNIIYDFENTYVDEISNACGQVKTYFKQNTMEKNYKIASNLIRSLRAKIFKKSKCPFGFLHKKGE